MVKEYWLVVADGRNVCLGIDDDVIYWDGDSSLTRIPLFKDRKEAQNFSRRAKRRLEATWVKTLRAKVL